MRLGATLYAYVHVRAANVSTMTKTASRQSARRSVAQLQQEPSSENAVRISVLLTKEERQRLKVLAASRGVTISDVVREGITRFLEGAS